MDRRRNNDYQAQVEERLLMGLAAVIVAAVAIVVIACAALPAVVAYLFDWRWLLVYPGVFATCVFVAGRKKR